MDTRQHAILRSDVSGTILQKGMPLNIPKLAKKPMRTKNKKHWDKQNKAVIVSDPRHPPEIIASVQYSRKRVPKKLT